ncbi:MAG TPA: hypothetical protein VH208_02395, partial [Myxococcaceae bacterium]|nr:hypothetical protein [Myxococcaceae bacterium]
ADVTKPAARAVPSSWGAAEGTTQPRARPPTAIGEVKAELLNAPTHVGPAPAKPKGFDPSDPFAPDPPGAQAGTDPSADPFALDSGEPKRPSLAPPPAAVNKLFEDELGSLGDSSAATSEPDRGLFDMPEAPPPASDGVPLDESPPPVTMSQPLARLTLTQAPIGKPAGRPQDVGMESAGLTLARRVSGVAVNLVVAALVVAGAATLGSAYLNDGKLDLSAITLQRVKGLWTRNELSTVDVSNGLYDTRGGRQIFFVRGEVANRGHRTSRVRVRAEILDGAQVLQSSEAWVGETPTPEDLFGLGSTQDAAALAARLDRGAVDVAPGSRSPFHVTFFEYPPDLAGLRLRVTLQRSDGATAAVR